MEIDKLRTCCFFGHRKINETPELMVRLKETIEDLIVNKEIHTFLFGSKSEFNNLCYKTVSGMKEKYPHVERIYVRAAYADISDEYTSFLLEHYEGTYYPEKMRGVGKAAYVERNQEMINQSLFCVVYYDENYLPPRRRNSKKDPVDYQPKSGTRVAYDYAVRTKKEIINIKAD